MIIKWKQFTYNKEKFTILQRRGPFVVFLFCPRSHTFPNQCTHSQISIRYQLKCPWRFGHKSSNMTTHRKQRRIHAIFYFFTPKLERLEIHTRKNKIQCCWTFFLIFFKFYRQLPACLLWTWQQHTVDNQPSFVPCINFTITIAFSPVSVVAERMTCSRATQWLVVDNWTLERL